MKNFKELTADIKANGLKNNKIVLLDGQFLDGVNRWEACKILEATDVEFYEYQGGDPISFVVSMNLKRRHLDTGQRAIIAVELATMRQGERTDKSLPQNCGKFTKTAAKELNVSTRSVETAKAVRKADPDLAEDVCRRGVIVRLPAPRFHPKLCQRRIGYSWPAQPL